MGKNGKYKVLLCLGLAALVLSCGKKNKAAQEDALKQPPIVESGTLAAINTKSFVLPRLGYSWEMRIIGLIEHGSMVNEGDSIMQLDPSDTNRRILERETDLETQLATMEKLAVDQANNINSLESAIKTQQASFDLNKISLEASRFESERARRIKELEFEQATITLEKEKRRLELAKTINENDLTIQKVRLRQIQNDIKNLKEFLPQFTIRTPVAGVFQVGRNQRTGSMINAGDMVYVGNSVGNVPELKHMKVETFINETDFLKIKVGQKVNVRLDAMPKEIFEGEITYVGKLCHPREQDSRQKVFDVEVRMLQPDERLKPGMTVSCEFVKEN